MGELFDHARRHAEQQRHTVDHEESIRRRGIELAERRLSEFLWLMDRHHIQPGSLLEYAGQSKVPLRNILRVEFTPFMPVYRMKELQHTSKQYREIDKGWHVMFPKVYSDGSEAKGIFVNLTGNLTGTTYDTDYDDYSVRVVEYRSGDISRDLSSDDAPERIAEALVHYGVGK